VEKKMIRVFNNQLIDQKILEFDLYNSKGALLFSKGQKIDPSFLLRISYLEIYREEENCKKIDELFEADEISQFIKELLLMAVKKQADTVEIEVSEKMLEVLISKDFELVEKAELESIFYSEILSRINDIMSIQGNFKEKEYKKSLELDIYGEKINLVIRLVFNNLDKFNIIFDLKKQNEKIIDLEKFNLSKNNFEKLKQIKNYNNGIFVFSGPIISGKDEFISSLLDKLFKNTEIKIWGPYEKYENYFELLKNILPALEKNKKNIIIFNISSKEIFPQKILNLASDNMVFINISGNNTPEITKKLLETEILSKDSFEKFKLLFFQKFVKKLCSNCRKPYKADSSTVNKIFDNNEAIPVDFFKAEGCRNCFDKGFSGKINIQEVFLKEKLALCYEDFITFTDKTKYAQFIQENEYSDIKYDCIKKVLRGLTDLGEFNSINI
jgi:type II secretory ATPase GspE/PulE/Tfp pilus assembly ATPase PilB-like protein